MTLSRQEVLRNANSADSRYTETMLFLIAGCIEFSGGQGATTKSGCDMPPGASCNPLVIGRFPYLHARDMSTWDVEDHIDVYDCAPMTNEQGPEVHYRLDLTTETTVRISVREADGTDVDLHLLDDETDTCLQRDNNEIEVTLPAGSYPLIVDTYHRDGEDQVGHYGLVVQKLPLDPNVVPDEQFWNTYYYLAQESDFELGDDTPILDGDCNPIANTSRAFYDDACMQGSGKLKDGRVVGYHSECSKACPEAPTCRDYDYAICFQELGEEFPWGRGAAQVPMVPNLSIAVDTELIELGTWLYIPKLDGVIVPGQTEPHNGCLRADDVGGAIEGNHIDMFIGSRDLWADWEALFPTGTWFETAEPPAGHCQ